MSEAAQFPGAEHALNVQQLWEKYEDIAMHFNGLLLRLRSQALAGIAVISTVVGIFTKEGNSDLHTDWLIATAIFIALGFFWIAIWCLDFLYYNRLLMGAVAALVKIEDDHKAHAVRSIHMSTHIDSEFSLKLLNRNLSRFGGVLLFYTIVLLVISGGALFSAHMYWFTN